MNKTTCGPDSHGGLVQTQVYVLEIWFSWFIWSRFSQMFLTPDMREMRSRRVFVPFLLRSRGVVIALSSRRHRVIITSWLALTTYAGIWTGTDYMSSGFDFWAQAFLDSLPVSGVLKVGLQCWKEYQFRDLAPNPSLLWSRPSDRAVDFGSLSLLNATKKNLEAFSSKGDPFLLFSEFPSAPAPRQPCVDEGD